MKPSDEKLITRFIDGELHGEELAKFEARMGSESELRNAVEGMAEIGEGIRGLFADADVVGHDLRMEATALGNIDVPNAEAFNAGIFDKIKGENPQA